MLPEDAFVSFVDICYVVSAIQMTASRTDTNFATSWTEDSTSTLARHDHMSILNSFALYNVQHPRPWAEKHSWCFVETTHYTTKSNTCMAHHTVHK